MFFGELAAWILAAVMIFGGEWSWALAFAMFALGTDIAGRVWSRKSPVPMPYFMRWVLLAPRGPHSPKRVMEVLQPRSGERILEIGPGIGIHALPTAAALLPDGVLDVLDIQQTMLDDLARRAEKFHIGNIMPRQGDARQLPYPDRSFDAAYLIGVLGEIPDAVAALCELRRVLRPGGRLLVSELFIDPDFVSLSALQPKAKVAGFVLQRCVGPGWAYSAVFQPESSDQAHHERQHDSWHSNRNGEVTAW
jgi:ubiquinone/menaquinone biosynthesis C-methylase UbiE